MPTLVQAQPGYKVVFRRLGDTIESFDLILWKLATTSDSPPITTLFGVYIDNDGKPQSSDFRHRYELCGRPGQTKDDWQKIFQQRDREREEAADAAELARKESEREQSRVEAEFRVRETALLVVLRQLLENTKFVPDRPVARANDSFLLACSVPGVFSELDPKIRDRALALLDEHAQEKSPSWLRREFRLSILQQNLMTPTGAEAPGAAQIGNDELPGTAKNF